jgi:hypothetical protein
MIDAAKLRPAALTSEHRLTVIAALLDSQSAR